ncbi:MAG: 7-cyano-7-deazaguanine synthase, partial [Campylobacter sp.]|nr:7-cyano-7-deazaguanine synthase [Campylobacter sp.]
MIVLPKICLEKLTSSKNLLAFSHGTDSTALFYILQANNIKFDIVMMDYNLRAQSKDEVAAATKLAKKFNKEIYLKSVFLNHSNFEANARQARYEFFAEICQKYGYENLILAH